MDKNEINCYRLPPEEINCTERDGKKILYNVDRLRIDANKKEKQVYNVDLIFNKEDSVNREYALEKISNEPIIVTKSDDDKYVILDGKHRLYKAKMNGQKK